jgi:para-nitrobenzyl esterase
MFGPSRYTASTMSLPGEPTYEYRFSYAADSRRRQWPGAPHPTEIPFVADTEGVRCGEHALSADQANANEYWVNFAKNGIPNGEGLPSCLEYKALTDERMDLPLYAPVTKHDCRPSN